MKKYGALLIVFLVAFIAILIFLLSQPTTGIHLKGFLMTMSILSLLWLVSLAIKDASIIDIFWGTGYVILAWFYAFQLQTDLFNISNAIFLLLVTIWGLRLSIYLAMRNLGKGEDVRYQRMRAAGGDKWWWFSFIQVFLLQGVLLWIISAVFIPALQFNGTFNFWTTLGISLWGIGFFFESVGDWQLARFKKDPSNKGKVMDRGLWKYTRHPNYFGDALLWWGYFCFALNTTGGWTYFFCPFIMTFLLIRVSGVAMLEPQLKKTKPKYADYIRKTPAFFPWFPKP